MTRIHKKILIRRVDNLGDIVIALPVIREIKKNFPGSLVYIMVHDVHRPILYKYADYFLKPTKLNSLYKKKWNYDLIFNIEYSFPKRYKPEGIRKDHIIHIGTPNWNKKQHIYNHLLDGLALHGLKINYSKPKVFLSPSNKGYANIWMRDCNFQKHHFNVIINPGSRFNSKVYDTGKYEQVCKWLIKTFNAHITILSKGCRDKEARMLFKKLPTNITRFLCNQPLDKVSAVISQHDLLIGNDSGTSHLAAALNVPTVTIFKVTPPGLWKPAGNKSIIVRKRQSAQFNQSHSIDNSVVEYLNTITANDVIDGIMLAIVKYIGLGKKKCFQKINISKNLIIQSHKPGVILQNKITLHSCYINLGWKYIEKLFSDIKKIREVNKLLLKYPNDLELINFLLLHRIIEFDK